MDDAKARGLYLIPVDEPTSDAAAGQTVGTVAMPLENRISQGYGQGQGQGQAAATALERGQPSGHRRQLQVAAASSFADYLALDWLCFWAERLFCFFSYSLLGCENLMTK